MEVDWAEDELEGMRARFGREMRSLSINGGRLSCERRTDECSTCTGKFICGFFGC